MIVVAGFLIAMLVGMTGVGAGTLTVPVLMIAFGVDPVHAVSAALMYSTAIKMLLVPLAAARQQVNWRVLGWMLLGGAPAAILGGLALNRMAGGGAKSAVQFILGLVITSAAAINLIWSIRKREVALRRDRSHWLAGLMFPVGLEVGFSSAGAGALGSVALLSMTAMPAAEIVGTDLAFGLGVSALAGGLHMSYGNLDTALLTQLLAGGLPGAAMGALVATRIPPRGLKVVLSCSLLLIGLRLCASAVR